MKFLLLLCFVVSAEANSAAEPLTLQSVTASVQTLYPLIGAAARDVESAQGELTAAEGAFDLTWRNRASTLSLGYYENYRFDSVIEKPLGPWGANLFAGYRLGTGAFAIYDEKAATLSGGEARLGVELSLWRNRPTDRRRTNVDKSRLGIPVAEANAIQTRIEAVRSASQKYWEWVAAGRRVQIFRELLSIAEARDKGLLERVRHGDVPEFERKDNERAILQRKAQLIAAERALQQSSIELSLFSRDESGNPKIPGEDVLPPKLERLPPRTLSENEDLERAANQRPELARIASQRDQSNLEAEWADNQIAPRVDLQLAASRDTGTGSVTRAGTELEAAVIIEIPLERRLATGRRESARATAQRIEATQKMTRDRIAAEVKDAHSALKAAGLRSDIAVLETELAKKLEQGERERFEHGDSNILFVNIREQATADARVREIEAIADYNKAQAQLKASIADL